MPYLIVFFKPGFFFTSSLPFVYLVHDVFPCHRFFFHFQYLGLNIGHEFRRIHKAYMQITLIKVLDQLL